MNWNTRIRSDSRSLTQWACKCGDLWLQLKVTELPSCKNNLKMTLRLAAMVDSKAVLFCKEEGKGKSGACWLCSAAQRGSGGCPAGSCNCGTGDQKPCSSMIPNLPTQWPLEQIRGPKKLKYRKEAKPKTKSKTLPTVGSKGVGRAG